MHRFALVLALLPLAATVSAASPAQPDLARRADAGVARVGNVDLFINEVETALDLAAEGEYGNLRRGDLQRLRSARDTIVDLLDDVDNARELAPEARIALYNAQETMSAILRNDDKNRIVCRKDTRTGSRVPKTECMTIAEREHRARLAQNAAGDIIRTACVPGQPGEEGVSRCGK